MLGIPLQRLIETDSTNRVALEWDEAPHGAGVFARAQSGGRGRLGRDWNSPIDKGLYLSVILRPEHGESLALHSLATALGTAVALETLSSEAEVPLRVRLKWPNDVLSVGIDGEARKIGGILCEATRDARGPKIVLGIGLNVLHQAEDLPPRPLFPASSLWLETGFPFEIEAVLQAVLGELDAVMCDSWWQWRHEFARRCWGIGDVVRVKTDDQTQIGIFEGIGDDGALLLRAVGGLKRIYAGDVAYL